MTSVFDSFRAEGDHAPGPDWQYLPLTDCKIRRSDTGEFAKLICLTEDGETIEALCDHKDFELLAPYLEELKAYQASPDTTETPVVPVFFGDKRNVWRFSAHGAQKHLASLGRLPAPTPSADPEEEDLDGAYRLQVTVTRRLAQRFKDAARRQGLTHRELLLHLIREHSS